MRYALVAFLTLLTGCGATKTASGKILDLINIPLDQRVQKIFDLMSGTGGVLTIAGTPVADIRAPAPVVSSYGTVTRGTTLNLLKYEDTAFLVYAEDGVFAAECETGGSADPLCQTYGVEGFNRTVVCFANAEGADIMVAQAWPGKEHALEHGRGLLCYVDGVKMLSSHVFTY